MAPRPLRIVGSCGEAWDAMTPRDAGRHCASCDRVVLDLAGMTLAEARAHVERARRETGAACGRAARDPATGELVFAPPPHLPRTPARGARGALLAAALVAGCETERAHLPRVTPVAHLVPLAPAPCTAAGSPSESDAGLPPPPPLPGTTATTAAAVAGDTPTERAAQRAAQRRKRPTPPYSGPVYEVGFMD